MRTASAQRDGSARFRFRFAVRYSNIIRSKRPFDVAVRNAVPLSTFLSFGAFGKAVDKFA